MIDMSINSIYSATEGEGIFIGTPQIFVRFQGCAIGCLNCDSKETWDFTKGNLSLASVLGKVEQEAGKYPHRVKRVSITGGDPLHPQHTGSVIELAGELKKRGYFVNIEASGARVVDSIFDTVDFISFDFKTPSTGVKTHEKLLEKVCTQYSKKSQIKSVISDKRDFEFVYDVLERLRSKDDFQMDSPWVLTPCYEPHEEFPKDRFIEVIKLNESFGSPFRVIGQQHKWIHGSSKRNV